MKKKVLVAMSGGVDSSVAAALLKEQGFSCIGVFMYFWSDQLIDNSKQLTANNRCCSIEAQEQARRVAQKIGIPLYTLNYQKEFKQIVVDYYIAEYQAGKTPNPCVVCNQFIKFDLLLREAQKQGCDYLATGHYAQISNRSLPLFAFQESPSSQGSKCERPNKNSKGSFAQDAASSEFVLKKAADQNKDQTYFLYRLTQDKLKKILFPVGKYQKPEVRKIAQKFDLPTATRKDSRGICFVSTSNEDFLRKYLKVQPGSIVDPDGVEIGEHEGLLYYTIGQRHINNSKFKMQNSKLFEKDKDIPPLYVVDIDIRNNKLVIGREEDLYKKSLIAEDVSWISEKEPRVIKLGARIRYRHPINDCRIKKLSEGKYQVDFEEIQRAITPGQSVVFYLGDEVLGGGVISSENPKF